MRILIIEDEIASIEKLKLLFVNYGTCEVAETGEQAAFKIKLGIENYKYYDLITIDIGLSDTDGLDLLKVIHDSEKKFRLKPAKKIIISSTGTNENVIKAKKGRCDGFLVKPVEKATIDTLFKKIGLRV